MSQTSANKNFMSAFRNIGLDVFNFLLASYNNSAERKKQVVRKSFRIVASRCLVHIAPRTVSVLLLWLNVRAYALASASGLPILIKETMSRLHSSRSRQKSRYERLY